MIHWRDYLSIRSALFGLVWWCMQVLYCSWEVMMDRLGWFLVCFWWNWGSNSQFMNQVISFASTRKALECFCPPKKEFFLSDPTLDGFLWFFEWRIIIVRYYSYPSLPKSSSHQEVWVSRSKLTPFFFTYGMIGRLGVTRHLKGSQPNLGEMHCWCQQLPYIGRGLYSY